jgi:hypothetical protein
MNQLSYDSIDQIEAAWTSTPEVRPGAVSDGDHIFRIDAYRIETSKDGNPMVYAELTAVGGTDDGQTIKRYNSLKNPNLVGRYKAELKDIGFDTGAASFSLKGFIDSGWMIEKHIVGNALNTKSDNGQNNCNIRLIRFATEADMAGIAASPAAAQTGTQAPDPAPAAATPPVTTPPAGTPAGAPAASPGNPWPAPG